jgi:hypothetical protein
MAGLLLNTAPLLLITGLSGHGLNLAYNNVTRLQKYEEQSEKAAEWSNTAAHRLHKTRTTQTSGALTVCSSSTHRPAAATGTLES